VKSLAASGHHAQHGQGALMSRYELTLPDLGIDDQPITVSSWFVKKGTRVKDDEPLVEVLCGGVTVDLPAGASGILIEKSVAEDEIVTVGQTLAVIEGE
jgi:2-oxoglutarate dehydrogenase E2 component (dihydrolipoamide succinyltransferase)